MNRIFFSFIFILLFTATASTAAPVKIGLTLGLTGKYQKMGIMSHRGIQLWAEQINAGKGLLGRKVKLIVYDDQSDKSKAKELYQKLVEKDKADLLLGPYSSGISGAILPISEKYGYPLLLLGASADSLWEKGYKNAFGVFIPASRYAVGFLEMGAMNGLTNIAIVGADDPFSKSVASGAKEWGGQFGLNINFFESFKKGTSDLIELAKRARASNPDAIVVCGHLNESVDMLLAMKKINWTPKAYFASVGPATNAFQEKLKDDANLAFSSSQWEPPVSYQPNDHKIFLHPFRDKFNETPTYQAAEAFAAGQILESAVIRAKSLDRQKISNILSKMDIMSIIGRYKVDKTGKQVRHFPITLQRQRGKKEIVWPDTLATAKPVFR